MTLSDRTPCAVVTGAGSGIGRCIALNLALSNWQVALIGRRPEALAESIALAVAPAVMPEAFACDVRDATAVESMASSVLKRFGRVHALINAAGINTPQRSLATLPLSDFRRVVETNLYGAYFCTQAFLPGMRQSGEGTIVNISSEAGRQASAKSGIAYVMSKFGLAGLTQSINVEERARGIRACCIFAGDVATPLLDYRPFPPLAEKRAQMLQPEDVATCVLLALTLPHRAIVEEIVISPTMK
ncbi:MAG TPA: SDR family oxidoreductase [Terriglobales bacterium]|nr:SDR family oxidoreductase [Terriglobales bacterium]